MSEQIIESKSVPKWERKHFLFVTLAVLVMVVLVSYGKRDQVDRSLTNLKFTEHYLRSTGDLENADVAKNAYKRLSER